MSQNQRICLFMPAYNVQDSILPVLRGIPSAALARIETVLVIDNGSTDGTLEQVARYRSETPKSKIRVFKNRRNYFLGGSTIIALSWAIRNGYDFLICMHSDGQADPACLSVFVDKCKPEIDFVFGSRFMPGSDIGDYSALRTTGNWLFVVLQQLILKKKIYDIGAFIGFNLKTVSEVPYARIPHDMGYQPLLVLLVARNKEIRFEEFPMRWGKVRSSNVNLITYGLTHLWRLFRFAAGSIPLSEAKPEDFAYDELLG